MSNIEVRWTPHGIHDSTADFWVHLFPLEKALYWYTVPHMLRHVERERPVEQIGHSKSGRPSGRGYLVPQRRAFVKRVAVPDQYLDEYQWLEGTDREVGMYWGEEVVDLLVTHNVLILPVRYVEALRRAEDQYSGADLAVRFRPDATVEVKTEILRKPTGNLFVQTHEAGHDVHITRVGERRITKAERLL
jgi:hypothetical protein